MDNNENMDIESWGFFIVLDEDIGYTKTKSKPKIHIKRNLSTIWEKDETAKEKEKDNNEKNTYTNDNATYYVIFICSLALTIYCLAE